MNSNRLNNGFQLIVSALNITPSMRHHKAVNVSEPSRSIDYGDSKGSLDTKFCGELITKDGRRMMLEIPSKIVRSLYFIVYSQIQSGRSSENTM